ncbi:hypothetical protein K437DRAFT_258286 [Tilletiaria anomala UBC 951]|uniref:Uncharacterized protein n=1 Tax=Tilletiaria anomala (strain ATCC 24038 / CBS 436.72 / UBC 951) TaxID=1037660 RepID=A0A066VRL8_TILAU|nr:uncharacterized protein K437DRAFT_258286 [Tilletiaria anomala UBC 951]KDN41439.1 hypothetical protein K437DRAFT_258286 [Tilletiaria anomala UBC 951]
MKKIDTVGSGVNKHIRAQQESVSGLSFKDRWRVAKGENVRWETTRKDGGLGAAEDDDESASVASASTWASTGHALPPSLPNRAQVLPGASSRPPPPPVRTVGAKGGSRPPPVPTSSKPGAVPAPPPRTGNAPPILPPRMGNEQGIDNPPPPYVGAKTGATRVPTAGARVPSLPAREAATSTGPNHIEFSKFDAAEKAAFFNLLDRYFAARGGDVTPASV